MRAIFPLQDIMFQLFQYLYLILGNTVLEKETKMSHFIKRTSDISVSALYTVLLSLNLTK